VKIYVDGLDLWEIYGEYYRNLVGIFLFSGGKIMSEKREKFVRLAEQRVNRALNDIRLIGNLSNRSAYSFTEEDLKKIFKTLQKELDQARSRFSEADSAAGGDFKL
jgi:tRNA A37 methylthiotransferase MiaB